MNELIARGVEVTDVVDHDWASMQERAEISIRRLGLEGAAAPAARAQVG